MNQDPLEFHDIGQDKQTEGLVLIQVNNLKYLGFTVDNNILDAELDAPISKGFKAFGGLRMWVWPNKNLSMKIECSVHRVI